MNHFVALLDGQPFDVPKMFEDIVQAYAQIVLLLLKMLVTWIILALIVLIPFLVVIWSWLYRALKTWWHTKKLNTSNTP